MEQLTNLAKWRRAVLNRDRWACIACGYHGPVVQAHHIESRSKNPELALVLDNGVCLCPTCHRLYELTTIPEGYAE